MNISRRQQKNLWYRVILKSLPLLLILLVAACSNDQPVTKQNSATPSKPATSSATPTGGPQTPTHIVDPGLAKTPLEVPTVAAGAQCPITAGQPHISPDYSFAYGNGPVYLANARADGILQYTPSPFVGDENSPFGGARIIWEIAPTYRGPVLIRGAQLNGTNQVHFNGGLTQTHGNAQGTEPQLNELSLQGDGSSPQWSTWITFTRIQSPGCYVYQIDGQNFSEKIVFQAQTT